jgi:hypothetical protein
VARIRSYTAAGCRHVTVKGQFTARDIRRFEHACAPALTSAALALEIDLSGVSTSDETANLLLDHMARRGARITSRPGRSAPDRV